MSHSSFPAGVTQATICAYFRTGVAAGVLSFQSSKDWAFSVIEQLDAPPIEIIEVATAIDRNSALDALTASAHGADHQVAGRLLLAEIHRQLEIGKISAFEATRAAMRVAQETALPGHVYYDFDCLDDELLLAVGGTYGTPADVTENILKTLAEHAGSA